MQALNASLWTRNIPFIHGNLPASVAAALIQSALSDIETAVDALLAVGGDDSTVASPARSTPGQKLTIFSINTGAGSPAPAIEATVNKGRKASPRPLLNFKLTSANPNEILDSWIALASHSSQLQFLPQPVDVSSPDTPSAAIISATSTLYDRSKSDVGHNALTFYLWLSTFANSYSKERAQQAAKHALQCSDGFAILSLEDRRLLNIIFGLTMQFWYLWLMTIFWFFRDWDFWTVIFTYPIPFLPALATWESFIASLGSRTFDEHMELVDAALGFKPIVSEGEGWVGDDEGVGIKKKTKKSGTWFDTVFANQSRFAEREGWIFEGQRVRYRWPLGYLIAFVGRRKDVRKRTSNSGV